MLSVIVERILPGVALAATFIGGSIVIVAQGIFSPVADSLERIIGGSFLAVVAWLVVRWTRGMLSDVQKLREKENDAALKREQLLISQLADSTQMIAELNAQLLAERKLRLSLEEKGITDRRKQE